MNRIYLCAALCSTILFVNCKKTISSSPQPPVVAIDSTSVVQLPVDSVTLTGVATGKSGATISTYLWAQLSGPGTATIVSSGTASSLIRNLVAGTYVFQLSVTDSKGLSASAVDTVVVNGFSTITLTPANNPNEVELWGYGSQDLGTNPNSSELISEIWTVGGTETVARGLCKFDLSGLPANAVVTGATLSLYSDSIPANGDLIHANYGAGDSMVIRQVTSSWTAATVQWGTQPSVTNANEVLIPATASATLDLPAINVTAIVSGMVTSGTNYGFEMALQDETAPYISRIFCSSKFSDASRHPSLTIQYYVPVAGQ
jgi:hypothetical protein